MTAGILDDFILRLFRVRLLQFLPRPYRDDFFGTLSTIFSFSLKRMWFRWRFVGKWVVIVKPKKVFIMKKRSLPILLVTGAFLLSGCGLINFGTASSKTTSETATSSAAGNSSTAPASSSTVGGTSSTPATSSEGGTSSTAPASSAPTLNKPGLDVFKNAIFAHSLTASGKMKEVDHSDTKINGVSQIADQTKEIRYAGARRETDLKPNGSTTVTGRNVTMFSGSKAYLLQFEKDPDQRDYLKAYYDETSHAALDQANGYAAWEDCLMLTFPKAQQLYETLTYSVAKQAFVSSYFSLNSLDIPNATFTKVEAIPDDWESKNGMYIAYSFSFEGETIKTATLEERVSLQQTSGGQTTSAVSVGTATFTFVSGGVTIDLPENVQDLFAYQEAIDLDKNRGFPTHQWDILTAAPSEDFFLKVNLTHVLTDDNTGAEVNWIYRDFRDLIGHYEFETLSMVDRTTSPAQVSGSDTYYYFGANKVYSSKVATPSGYRSGPYVDQAKEKTSGDGAYDIWRDLQDSLSRELVVSLKGFYGYSSGKYVTGFLTLENGVFKEDTTGFNGFMSEGCYDRTYYSSELTFDSTGALSGMDISVFFYRSADNSSRISEYTYTFDSSLNHGLPYHTEDTGFADYIANH